MVLAIPDLIHGGSPMHLCVQLSQHDGTKTRPFVASTVCKQSAWKHALKTITGIFSRRVSLPLPGLETKTLWTHLIVVVPQLHQNLPGNASLHDLEYNIVNFIRDSGTRRLVSRRLSAGPDLLWSFCVQLARHLIARPSRSESPFPTIDSF